MDNEKNLPVHTLVFKEGTPANKLYLVKRGEVLCLKASKDRLIPVFMARSGDILGENAMIADLDYTYSAVTNSAVELVEIPSTNFTEVLNSSPDWLVELTTTMISRFQSTASLIAENRLIHPSIIGEDEFTNEMEIEFRKLLS